MAIICCSYSVASAEEKLEDKSTSVINNEFYNLHKNQKIQSMGEAEFTANSLMLWNSYKEALKKEEEEKKEKEANIDFAGFNWGIGLALTSIANESINEAKAVNGKVRVTKSHEKNIGLMFETHHFITPWKEHDNIGIGPFAAIGVKDTSNINASTPTSNLD